MSLIFMLLQNHSFFSHIVHLLHDGGMFFMLPILLVFFLVLFLILKIIWIIKKEKTVPVKYVKLLNSVGLIILVWGVLGQLLGLVEAFDKIEMLDSISTEILASGLKISALPTMFGCLVFVISRTATTVFTWFDKEGSK